MKGARLTIAWRTVLFMSAAIITLISSIILVRRLDYEEYATFQSLTKRASFYVIGVYVLFEMWIYRDAVERSPSTYLTYLLGSSLTGIAGIISGFSIIYMLTHNTEYSLLGALLLQGVWLSTRTMLDALRPRLVSVIHAVQRMLYVSFIILLVYFLGEGLLGALTSFILGFLISVPIAFYLASKRINLEWWEIKREHMRMLFERLKGGLGRSLYTIAPNLDIVIIQPFMPAKLIAAYFANRVPAAVFGEIGGYTIRFLQAERMKGVDLSNLLSILNIFLFIVIPFLSYISVNHLHVIYLLNSKYAWSSTLISFFSLGILFAILNNAMQNIIFGEKIEDEKERLSTERKLSKYMWMLSAPGVIYLVLTPPAVYFAPTDMAKLYAWVLLFVFQQLAILIVAIGILRKKSFWSNRIFIRDSIVPILKYSILSLALSYVFKPWNGPYQNFWKETLVLLEAFTPYAVAYVVLAVFLFSEIRSLVLSAWQLFVRRRSSF